jgi:RNA polymerase primary sigma factor
VVSPASLSEPLHYNSQAELGDFVEDHAAVSPFAAAAAALLSGDVARMLTGLDDREREIIQLRFGLSCGEPQTLEEIGGHFGLSRERIRQIEAGAMEKLRHPTAGPIQRKWTAG